VHVDCDVLCSGTHWGALSRPSTTRWLAKRKSFTCSCIQAGALETTTPHTPRRRRRNVAFYTSSSSRWLTLMPACRHLGSKTIQVTSLIFINCYPATTLLWVTLFLVSLSVRKITQNIVVGFRWNLVFLYAWFPFGQPVRGKAFHEDKENSTESDYHINISGLRLSFSGQQIHPTRRSRDPKTQTFDTAISTLQTLDV